MVVSKLSQKQMRLSRAFFQIRNWLTDNDIYFKYKDTEKRGLCEISYDHNPPRPIGVILDPRMRSWERKIITLAHETGHVVDLIETPLDEREVHVMLTTKKWSSNPWVYWRETKAWLIGADILKNLHVFELVKQRFIYIRETALRSYNSVFTNYLKEVYNCRT